MHYAIGDVHGCFTDLMKLLVKIEEKDDNARFIFVGDFIDRGPEVWKTLEWAKSHVTKTGKYRSVLGNHEAMIVGWYHEFCRWYEYERGKYPAPLPMYDFLERLVEQEKDSPEETKPYIDFFKKMPLKITVRVPGRGRRHVVYDIVHAWVPPAGLPGKARETYYLWDRENSFAGNEENGHIIIHGHTPTTYEAKYIPEAVPGMITYRKRALNIDGGCVFADHHPLYPCMLCAVCLETLEEIYPYSLAERMDRQMPDSAEEIREAVTEKYEQRHREYLLNEYRTEIMNCLQQNAGGRN